MERKFWFLALVLFLLAVGCAKPLVSAESDLSIDSDGDGFGDWFEANIAHTDPTTPNNRYIIIYCRSDEDPKLPLWVVDKPAQFFEKCGVSPENIFRLIHEGATYKTLEAAINQVAAKSTGNDIVFLSLNGHGGGHGIEGSVTFTDLNVWLNRIEAKTVIVQIAACGSEYALPILKEGSSPRIIFAQTGSELIGAMGEYPGDFQSADAKYGDGNGYVSFAEIARWSDWEWGKNGKAWSELYGFSKMSDVSGIASRTYLTDYSPKLDKSLKARS